MAQEEEKKQKKMKNKKKEKKGGAAQDNHSKSKDDGEVITDARFSSLHWDPRFQRVPKHQSKVALDSRFQRIFTDKSFSSSSAPLDKRGKPKKGKPQNHLLHYYHQEQEEEEKEEEAKELTKSDEDEEEKNDGLRIDGGDLSDSESSESEPSPVEEDVHESENDTTSSSSTDDEDSDDIYSEEDVPSEKEDVPVIERETHRLAIVNMDWNHVRAVDLYVALSTDLPKGGQILSVATYPSEFGLQRMEEESVHGPTALFDSDKEHSDDDDDDEIDNEKLRAYEKSRLRYYYAVVECDSSATADHLYKIFDGVEFERTSNKLDMRFIPDSMEFKHPPREVATEAPTKYEALDFTTPALQQTKIHLSWDDDEPNRKKILKRKFKPDQLDEMELKEFLASDDGETDDDDENDEAEALPNIVTQKPNKRDMYRSLIQSGDGSDTDGDGGKDMEVTFNTGLEDISKRILEKQDRKSETVWDAYLRKRSEKKKAKKRGSKLSSSEDSDYDQEAPDQPDDFFIEESLDADVDDNKKSSKKDSSKKTKGKKNKTERRQSLEDPEKEQVASREELELLLTDDKGTERSLKGYNLKSKKAKRKRGKEMLAEDKLPSVDYYDDPRFARLFTSHLFTLDPTDPQFKRSATYLRQLTQKQQKGRGEEAMEIEELQPIRQVELLSDDRSSKKQKRSPADKHELASLVQSVKRKVGTYKAESK